MALTHPMQTYGLRVQMVTSRKGRFSPRNVQKLMLWTMLRMRLMPVSMALRLPFSNSGMRMSESKFLLASRKLSRTMLCTTASDSSAVMRLLLGRILLVQTTSKLKQQRLLTAATLPALVFSRSPSVKAQRSASAWSSWNSKKRVDCLFLGFTTGVAFCSLRSQQNGSRKTTLLRPRLRERWRCWLLTFAQLLRQRRILVWPQRMRYYWGTSGGDLVLVICWSSSQMELSGEGLSECGSEMDYSSNCESQMEPLLDWVCSPMRDSVSASLDCFNVSHIGLSQLSLRELTIQLLNPSYCDFDYLSCSFYMSIRYQIMLMEMLVGFEADCLEKGASRTTWLSFEIGIINVWTEEFMLGLGSFIKGESLHYLIACYCYEKQMRLVSYSVLLLTIQAGWVAVRSCNSTVIADSYTDIYNNCKIW